MFRVLLGGGQAASHLNPGMKGERLRQGAYEFRISGCANEACVSLAVLILKSLCYKYIITYAPCYKDITICPKSPILRVRPLSIRD